MFDVRGISSSIKTSRFIRVSRRKRKPIKSCFSCVPFSGRKYHTPQHISRNGNMPNRKALMNSVNHLEFFTILNLFLLDGSHLMLGQEIETKLLLRSQ